MHKWMWRRRLTCCLWPPHLLQGTLKIGIGSEKSKCTDWKTTKHEKNEIPPRNVDTVGWWDGWKKNIYDHFNNLVLLIFRLNIGKNDLVTFYDGDDLTAKVLGQYAGSKSRFKLYTSTADVTIQFQSDPATNIYGYGNGFVVHFFGKCVSSCRDPRKVSPPQKKKL